jgi:Sec-independent protein translocase protein TatA
MESTIGGVLKKAKKTVKRVRKTVKRAVKKKSKRKKRANVPLGAQLAPSQIKVIKLG